MRTIYKCDFCGHRAELDELTDREGALTCPCCGAFTGLPVLVRVAYIAAHQPPAAEAAAP